MMASDAIYPKREKFYALRFTRLLTKRCLAQEVRPVGVLMLIVIAHQEDASHYRRGVTFYDAQLMPLIGLNSKKTMTKVRNQLVEMGWLSYQPGHKGKASTYWTMIPPDTEGLDDLPTDESFDECGSQREPNTGNAVPDCGKKGTSNGQHREPQGGHYIPNPIPTPVAQQTSEQFEEQAKPKVLSERFVFFWSERKAGSRTPRSAVEIEPQFAEHLRRYPGHYDAIRDEIENKSRNRNEWPDKLLARFEIFTKHQTQVRQLPSVDQIKQQEEAEAARLGPVISHDKAKAIREARRGNK